MCPDYYKPRDNGKDIECDEYGCHDDMCCEKEECEFFKQAHAHHFLESFLNRFTPIIFFLSFFFIRFMIPVYTYTTLPRP